MAFPFVFESPVRKIEDTSRRPRLFPKLHAGILAEVAAAGLPVTALLQIPMPVFIHAWLIPMLIINTFLNIRGMSQHTLLEEHHNDEVPGTRTILTTFFMCNENYHLEHHLYPGVP